MHIQKKILVRILISLAIIIIIFSLWLIKNQGNENALVSVVASTPKNPDFALEVTKPLDMERLKSYDLPIMIDFGADSCAPCKEMAPVLYDLNERLQGKAIIRFVDVWKDQSLVANFPVRVIPTQFFFNADGSPYAPSDLEGSGMLIYSSKDTKEHVLTAHEGGMTEQMILEVLKDMGLNND